MTDAATVGELDGDAEVLRLTDSSIVHLGRCPVIERARRDPQRKPVSVLFDDTEVCSECRGRDYNAGGGMVLPTQTEVPSDD